MSYYLGTFMGLAIVYLGLFGWWLDHILASSGWVVSLSIQGLAAGFFGYIGTGQEGYDPGIGYPVFFVWAYGAAAVALAHALGRKVAGSFKPAEEVPLPYSPSGM